MLATELVNACRVVKLSQPQPRNVRNWPLGPRFTSIRVLTQHVLTFIFLCLSHNLDMCAIGYISIGYVIHLDGAGLSPIELRYGSTIDSPPSKLRTVLVYTNVVSALLGAPGPPIDFNTSVDPAR